VRPSWELAPGKGPDHPVGRARCQERCEEVGHRRLDFFIGVDGHRSFVIMDVASRKPPAKFTTCGGRPAGLVQAAGQDVELGFLSRRRSYADINPETPILEGFLSR
jgi:hypothetical protein